MTEHKVWIGTVVAMSNGATEDRTRAVVFEGERVGSIRTRGIHNGAPSDTRGTEETLYRAADDRLIVHVHDWSHWQGEPDTYTLREVTETDLQVGGEFEDLGAACGFGRPLTLSEALAYNEAELAGVIEANA